MRARSQTKYILVFKIKRIYPATSAPFPSSASSLAALLPVAASLLPPLFAFLLRRKEMSYTLKGRKGEKWRPLRFSPFLLPSPALVPFFTFSLLRVVLGRPSSSCSRPPRVASPQGKRERESTISGKALSTISNAAYYMCFFATSCACLSSMQAVNQALWHDGGPHCECS